VDVELRLDLPRDLTLIRLVREVSRCFLRRLDAPEETVEELALAITEACANANAHATEADDFTIALIATDDGCDIEIVDTGPPYAAGLRVAGGSSGAGDDAVDDPAVDEAAQIEALLESGRGLHLMEAFADDLTITREGDRNCLRLRKSWSSA
jgi:serine/threonine-protein kinase RsbW